MLWGMMYAGKSDKWRSAEMYDQNLHQLRQNIDGVVKVFLLDSSYPLCSSWDFPLIKLTGGTRQDYAPILEKRWKTNCM
jgi:hypothetical protein